MPETGCDRTGGGLFWLVAGSVLFLGTAPCSGRASPARRPGNASKGDGQFLDAVDERQPAPRELLLRDGEGQVGEAAEQRREDDPQILFPALATHAFVLYRAEQAEEAGALATEVLARWADNASSMAGQWIAELAWVLEGLGRGAELTAASASSARTRWLAAALALAEGNGVEAAEEYERMGTAAYAAITRVRAAEQLLAARKRGQAEAQLELARPFFEAAGASAYLERADAVLASV